MTSWFSSSKCIDQLCENTITQTRARVHDQNPKMYLSSHSLSKNPIGNEGFSVIMDALIARPQSSVKKLGWADLGAYELPWLVIECFILHDLCSSLHILIYRVFGCEITGKALPKLVDFFAMTETFEIIQWVISGSPRIWESVQARLSICCFHFHVQVGM